MSTNAFDQKTGKLRVCEKRCNECLFSNNKIVSDERKLNLLEQCARTGRYFLCHKHRGVAVVCRGFFDEQANPMCQVAERLGAVDLVERKST